MERVRYDPTPLVSADPSTQAAVLQKMIATIARQVAKEEIDAALRNLRPGGLVPYAVTLAPPTANLVTEAAALDIPYPGFLHSVTFRGTTPGSATLDLWVRRPTQTAVAAVSIVGANFPSITAATDSVVVPFPDWRTFIEADSTVYFYLTAASGFLSLTIHLWLRATTGVTL